VKNTTKIGTCMLVAAVAAFVLVIAQGRSLSVALIGAALAAATVWGLFMIIYLGGGGS
jgi:hypothetical protein